MSTPKRVHTYPKFRFPTGGRGGVGVTVYIPIFDFQCVGSKLPCCLKKRHILSLYQVKIFLSNKTYSFLSDVTVTELILYINIGYVTHQIFIVI